MRRKKKLLKKKRLLRIVLGFLLVFSLALSFYLGMKVQEHSYRPIESKIIVPEVRVERVDVQSELGLESRCGSFPSKVVGQFKVDLRMSGPDWASDCRHFAWAIFSSGETDKDTRASYDEGVYLYNDATGRFAKIYSPRYRSEKPLFQKWQDRQSFLFTTVNGVFLYDLVTKRIESQ